MFLQDLSKPMPIFAVTIGKQVFRNFPIPGGLQNLPIAPIRGRMFGHIPMKNLSGVDGKNHHHVQLLESNRDYIKKVHGPNLRRVVGKEGSPALGSVRIGTIPKPPDDSHHSTFGNSNSQLQ